MVLVEKGFVKVNESLPLLIPWLYLTGLILIQNCFQLLLIHIHAFAFDHNQACIDAFDLHH